MKQIERTPDIEAISFDGIDTTSAWMVESEEPAMELASEWLEDTTQVEDEDEHVDMF